MVFTLQIADDGGGLVGDQLRAHRGDHVLLGKNACRRLAKILPYLVKDSGTAAVVNYPLAEWLATAILRLEAAAQPGSQDFENDSRLLLSRALPKPLARVCHSNRGRVSGIGASPCA